VVNADKPRDQYGSGGPIAGAQVQLISLDLAGLSFSAVSDANSVARIIDIPAGRYAVTVKAAGFADYTGTEVIQPGITNTGEILLPTQMVTYTWSVTPTTITDSYDLKLSFTYKTDVPAPAVIISPSVFNFNLESDSSADGQMTVTNQGLVSAFNVQALPKTNDPHITIDMPYPVIAELKAGQTVNLPFRVSLHSPQVCYQGSINTSGEYTCAAGSKVSASWPGTQVNVNCGVAAGSVSPSAPASFPENIISGGGGSGGSSSVVTQTSGSGVTMLTAGSPPAPTRCACSMKVTGPDSIEPGETMEYTGALDSQSCIGCNMSCSLGAEWTITGDLNVVLTQGCLAQVKATGYRGGTLTLRRNAEPKCNPGELQINRGMVITTVTTVSGTGSFTTLANENAINLEAEISPPSLHAAHASEIKWEVTPLNAADATDSLVNPANGASTVLTAVASAAPNGRGHPISFKVKASVTIDGNLSEDEVTVKQDNLDELRQEYIDMNKTTKPMRSAFVNSLLYQNPGNFSFNEIKASDYDWALFTITAKLQTTRDSLPGLIKVMAITPGNAYRNPVKNATQDPPGATNSRHIYGLAADIEVADYDGNGTAGKAADWELIKSNAHLAGLCVEPADYDGRESVYTYIHLDDQGACPTGW